jgi:hypothetical protein
MNNKIKNIIKIYYFQEWGEVLIMYVQLLSMENIGVLSRGSLKKQGDIKKQVALTAG